MIALTGMKELGVGHLPSVPLCVCKGFTTVIYTYMFASVIEINYTEL